MAAVLGIHAADIKVVSVYEGSTIVDFFVEQAENLDDALDLEQVQETFAEVVSTMDTFMGSPILNAVASGVNIITKNSGSGDHAADAIFIWDELIQ
jgi:hypothetical protein